jgi:esterase/lipase
MDYIQSYVTNHFVFRNPTFDYKSTDLDSKSIIFINKDNQNSNKIENYIPCLFIQEYEQSSNFIIFFHGNSEDIFISELLGQYFSEKFKMNVVIVEYPGYSIYKAKKSAETMCNDSLIVYDFIKRKFNLQDKDIYVIGRSIGTGPSVFLATLRTPRALILISPFKSIKSIKNKFISFFLLDIFKSIELIDKVSCPVLFIHGKNDHLIDPSHSEELLEKSKNHNNKLIINPNMTHNDMDIENDVFDKILVFINKQGYSTTKGHFNLFDKQFKELFEIPIAVQKHLFIENMNLEKPNIIKINGNYSILLRDERIAVTTINEIIIYELEEMQKEITIKTDKISSVNYLYQLSNNNLVAVSNMFVVIYSLGKYKYETLREIKIQSVRKIEEYNNNEIMMLLNNGLYSLNKENKIEQKMEGFYNDIKIIDNFIFLFKSKNSIIVYTYVDNNLDKIKEIAIDYTPDTLKKLLYFENKILVIDENSINIICLNENLNKHNIIHLIENPSYALTLFNNFILIGNKNGNIKA